jgi:hypothetical protein
MFYSLSVFDGPDVISIDARLCNESLNVDERGPSDDSLSATYIPAYV